MHGLRRLSRTHHRIAILIALLLVAMRLAVPVGFMPAVQDGRLTVVVCSGTDPAASIEITIPGAATGEQRSDGDDHGKRFDAAPCAFAGLALPMLGAVDPILLLAALLFALALPRALEARPLSSQRARLRPPLRGPPLPA